MTTRPKRTRRKKKARESLTETQKEELDIDEFSLDEEWVNQPRMYRQWATQLADAKADHQKARDNTKLVEAECYVLISNDPEKFGLEKRTESGIKALIPTLQKYKEAQEAEIEAQHKADVLGAVVTSLSHRKTALEKLVDLRLADYFAEPKARTKQSRRAMENMRDKKVLSRKRSK